jgi:hypothetical protein
MKIKDEFKGKVDIEALARDVRDVGIKYENETRRQMTKLRANKITGPNAGGLRQLPIRTPLAARVGQFWR